jgi:hypothetical protein
MRITDIPLLCQDWSSEWDYRGTIESRRRFMRRISYLLFVLIFLFPLNIHAHVVIFYRYRPMIYEISHRSVIVYDRENQKVGLVPQISFRGSPEDFCIVVPTPGVPMLNTVNTDVFFEAEELTSPVREERGTSGCQVLDFVGGGEEEEEYIEGVDILKEESVGVFDTVTLSATDPDALINWLQENEYDYSVADKDIIDYYIQRGWVFTAVKIDIPSESAKYYDRYNINPILFRYSASSLVYPVRLASINAGDSTDIVIYVLSDSKMTFPGAKIEYANRIDDRELEEILERYPAFGGLIGRQRYLTKLRRTFSIMEMDTDIEIVSAPDNEELREVIYYGVSPATDFIPLGIVAAFFLASRMLSKKRNSASSRT